MVMVKILKKLQLQRSWSFFQNSAKLREISPLAGGTTIFTIFSYQQELLACSFLYNLQEP